MPRATLERDLKQISLPAAADLSDYQYRAVLVDTDGRVNIATGTATAVIGVLQNKPSGTAHAAVVGIDGVTRMVAAASITAGAWVSSNGEGMATTETGVTSKVIGRALTTAGASLDYLEVLLQPHQL